MALAFLSLFALAVGALLAFADSAFRASVSAHDTVAAQYSADAAIDGAVNAIRSNVGIGKDGASAACFSLPAQVNATAVTVQCAGRPGSGASTAGSGGGLVPANSVLTLPGMASEGIVVSATAAPVVTGNALTKQTSAVPAGASLTVQGDLTCRAATGTGTVVASSISCPAATAPDPADPGYAPPFVSSPALVTTPACGAGATVTFVPGKYISAASLNALTGGACTNKRFVFTPGYYYFEFADATTHQWLVNDATAEVVGGALTASAFPNRCDLAAAGVEFVFGGDSRLAVSAGSLELCPPLPAGQRIAVYGVPASTPAINGYAAPKATTAVNAGATPFTSPASGAVIDGNSASVSLCNKCEASETLTGYSASAVPDNAIITGAWMFVADQRDASPGTSVSTLTAGDGTAVDYPLTPCVQPCANGANFETIDVKGTLDTPARANGLSVTYTATDTPGRGSYSVDLDGVSFLLTYTIPGLTASSGCAISAPYNPASATTCAVLKGTGSATTKMAIKGTVYAPLAAVDLSMTGQLTQVTQRGIIARTLQLGLTRGAGYAGGLLTLPGSADRRVLLTASIAGVARLRADVTFADGLGFTPGRTITITRWSVLR